jgi:outer membrane protein insertion porin family
MAIKEEKIWRFWSYESHIFREDNIDADLSALSLFYRSNGFPFFAITSASAEMDFAQRSHYCTFAMEEGERYTIGNVTLESKVSKIRAADFRKYISITKGSVFNASLIESEKKEILHSLSQNGHPFIAIKEEVSFNRKTKTADVKYTIVEKAKAFIERIEIVGNFKTLDKVIRREFTLHEGDPINAYEIHVTTQRLNGIGYFDEVTISEEEGSAPDRKVLVVKVKEKESTARISFGGGISDADGFSGVVSFGEDNLFGTGVSASSEIAYAQRFYGGKIDVFFPRFMDRNFGAGLKLGAHNIDRERVDQSILRSAYISPYVRYQISKNLAHYLRYRLSANNRYWWDKVNGVRLPVPPAGADGVLMRDEYGKFCGSEVSSTFVRDMTDNPYAPRRGHVISLSNAYSGLLGDVKYFKTEVAYKYYYPIGKKITFIFDASVGHLHEISGTRTCHRFELGGDGTRMRGFDTGGVGPRDLQDSYIGGTRYWSASFVAKAPLSTKEIGINGLAFIDFGSVWGSKYPSDQIKDSSAVRASIGVAIEWEKCPLGMPISFVFGFPLKKQSFDKKQTLTFAGLT